MKEKVYGVISIGEYFYEAELNIDLKRDLTEKDHRNIREVMSILEELLLEESVKLNPKSLLEAKNEEESFIGCFENIDFTYKKIQNEYCSKYCCKHLPWYIFKTSIGDIKIGWRKRVIVIDWSNTVVKKTALNIFEKEENVTKSGYMIHADNYLKAKEYVRAIYASKHIS
jgi:hypothetical protein